MYLDFSKTYSNIGIFLEQMDRRGTSTFTEIHVTLNFPKTNKTNTSLCLVVNSQGFHGFGTHDDHFLKQEQLRDGPQV
jgi:hypothetical protein